MKETHEYIVPEDGRCPVEIGLKIKEFNLKNVGKKITATFSNEKNRTLPQNSWFHKINSMVTEYLRNQAKEQGNEEWWQIDEDSTKIWIKQTFLGWEEKDGEKKLRKTSNLKTFQMNELWEALQIYFAPKGLNLPDPNQTNFINEREN